MVAVNGYGREQIWLRALKENSIVETNLELASV
jgi:hypothetical protein